MGKVIYTFKAPVAKNTILTSIIQVTICPSQQNIFMNMLIVYKTTKL